MEGVVKDFEFKQCVSIPKFTGKKAGDLRKLKEAIAVTSDEAIFHHIYQYFLRGHRLEYTNDFAHWVGENLEERALSEQLSNIDPYNFTNIVDLRNELLGVMDNYLKQFPEPREVTRGSEFHFNETITLIFPVGTVSKNLAEFLLAIRYIDTGSIYYHFFEARMRLGGGIDDFSKWFEDVLEKNELAEKIRGIDLFMHDIEGIRNHIVEVIEEEVAKGMEVISQ